MEIIPVTETVSIEVGEHAVTIATRYPWSEHDEVGLRREFASVRYDDLPHLLRRLVTVLAGHCSRAETEALLQTVLLAAGHAPVAAASAHSAA